jgi:uncharacterized protein
VQMSEMCDGKGAIAYTTSWGLRRLNEIHFHVTEKCNLSCRYCYAATVGHHPNDTGSMSLEVFQSGLDVALASSRVSEVSVIFHGGEPLLLPSRVFYQPALSYVRTKEREENKRVIIGIQSNLTLLDREIATLLADYNVSLGGSIDGPAELHNQMRSDLCGRPSQL